MTTATETKKQSSSTARCYVIDLGSNSSNAHGQFTSGGTDAVVAGNATEALLVAALDALLALRREPHKDDGESKAVEFRSSIEAQFVSKDASIREAFTEAAENYGGGGKPFGALVLHSLDVSQDNDSNIMLLAKVRREAPKS